MSTLIASRAGPQSSQQGRVFRANLQAVDSGELRVAHLAIRLLLTQPQLAERFEDGDFTLSLWKLCLPLFDRADLEQRMIQRTKRESEIRVAASRAASDDPDQHLPPYPLRRIEEDVACAIKLAPGTKGRSGKQQEMRREELQSTLLALSAADMQTLAQADGTSPTSPSVRLLAHHLQLNEAEQRLLDMAEKRDSSEAFCTFLRECHCPARQAPAVLAAVLGCDTRDIRLALRAHSALVSLDLLSRMQWRGRDLEDAVEPGDGLRMLLLAQPQSHTELLATLAEPPVTGQWTLEDFPHLANDAARVCAVLRQAGQTGEAGVNALFYGAPGMGKTEFACALAAAAGLQAFRVRTEDEDGDPLSREGRLSAYAMLQRLLRNNRQCVLVFDEVEDVFSHGAGLLDALLGGDEAAGQNKGWMNRTLEENPVPAIWITNHAASMDSAFLRRFLLPVAFGTPPLAVRQRMVQAHLPDGLVPDALRDQLAQDAKLQPAQFGMARRLLALTPGADAANCVRQGIAASRRLLHGSGLARARQSPTVFDIEYLNVAGGIAPARMAEALRRTGQGRLCFFGLPGTGKTEFAHILAQALDRERVSRTAADLMSKWVGETEQNIAELFNTADPERSIILLDEVDSLLRSRTLADKSWEATQVNQLLQSMENYPGILIAATNLAEKLDAAALRRFDFKLEFRPLRPDQRLHLFAREALGDASQASSLPRLVAERLNMLEGLTVGDFANVARQSKLLGEALSAEEYLRRLALELRIKRG